MRITEVVCTISQGDYMSSSLIFVEGGSSQLQETSTEAALVIRKFFVLLQNLRLLRSVAVLTLNKYIMALLLHSMLSNKCAQLLRLCPILCYPMDCSLPGSSVHRILQTRILEWVAIALLPGNGNGLPLPSSWPRGWTHISCVSCIAGGFSTTEPPRKPMNFLLLDHKFKSTSISRHPLQIHKPTCVWLRSSKPELGPHAYPWDFHCVIWC